MLVNFEYTGEGHCEQLESAKKLVLKNKKFKASFPDVEFKSTKVDGANYFVFKCMYDGKVKEIDGLRIDLLSNFLKKHYNFL